MRPAPWAAGAPASASASGTLGWLGPARGQAQLVAFVCTFGVGYGATFTLVQSRAAQIYGGRPDFPALQSCLAVGQYMGSFLGVVITSQLRAASGSFVTPFAIFPLLGLANFLLCVRVFRP